jgi:hypothetical protein
MFSLRVSTQRTGRPVCLAAQATTSASRSTPILAPKPPPTSGATTRTAPGSRPSFPAAAPRAIWAFCVLSQSVSRSSAHTAAADRTSSGTAASRWLVMVRSTTTSQPSNRAGSGSRSPPDPATFDSVPGNSSVPPSRAASMLATAGSGS